MDSLSEKINIYDIECKLERVITPKFDHERSDVIVMSINWSATQMRVIILFIIIFIIEFLLVRSNFKRFTISVLGCG